MTSDGCYTPTMPFADWSYEECPRCGRTVVTDAAEAHNAKYHAAVDAPPTEEERMKRVLTDDQLWGKG